MSDAKQERRQGSNRPPAIDATRLWQSLMEMARIGATEKGGVRRLTLTDEDRESRDLFVTWAEAAGCTVTVDRIGNIFARRPGRDNSLPPVLVGSHLDSQPSGGKFDGAYGVLAALEIVRTLNDHGVETLRPIEAVSWTNEEGARFAPATMGSAAFAGALDLQQLLAVTDLDGKTAGAELERIGYAGTVPCGGRDLHAYFEAHIEQGPILEAEEKTIGVVQGIQGIRWFDCRVSGQDSHAGPTPMERRRDALLGAAAVIEAVNRVALDHAPDGRATVGQLQVLPNSRNVVPGQVDLSVDMRNPDDDVLATMAAELASACEKIAGEKRVDIALDQIWHLTPTHFDAGCVEAVRAGAEALGVGYRAITSGAGHDATYLAEVCPSAMVFIPCKDGLSHNELEDATPEHVAAGCAVLLEAALAKANEPG